MKKPCTSGHIIWCSLRCNTHAQREYQPHAVVLGSLNEAVDEDLSLVVSVCEAIEKLPLTRDQRQSAVDSMLQRLNTVAPEDVADLAFFVLRSCTSGDHALRACQVCTNAVWLLVWMINTAPCPDCRHG
jgi:hypothetical protein